MGLRRSIMGFDQEEVLRLTKVIKKEVSGKEKEFELKLDLNDLLILKQIADFPNRKKITKVIVDEKIFFWVSYKEIIKELPILGIGKQALSDRLDKMVKLGVLEREIKTMPPYANMTLFRIGDNYEQLKYKDEYQNDSIVENNGKVSYSDTIGYRSQTRDINNEYNNNNEDDNNKEEIDKSISKKEVIDFDSIVSAWNEIANEVDEISSIRGLTDKRKKQIMSLLKTCNSTCEELVRFIKTLPYADNWVIGKGDRKWSIDFDWLIQNTSNWYVAGLEGNMHKKNRYEFDKIMRGEEVLKQSKKLDGFQYL